MTPTPSLDSPRTNCARCATPADSRYQLRVCCSTSGVGGGGVVSEERHTRAGLGTFQTNHIHLLGLDLANDLMGRVRVRDGSSHPAAVADSGEVRSIQL